VGAQAIAPPGLRSSPHSLAGRHPQRAHLPGPARFTWNQDGRQARPRGASQL